MKANFSDRAAWLTAAAALLATGAWAQVGAPVLGYFPNRGQIMPVHGIAASASVAAPIQFGRKFLETAVSPRQDFALVSDAESGAVSIAYPAGNTVPVDGIDPSPSRIEMSPSGSAAVLWYASARQLEILSGLPGAPALRKANTGFLTSDSSDQPTSLAISDDGAWATGAWTSGVWAFGPNGEVHSVLMGVRALGLGFFVGRQDLAVATSSGISTVSDVGGAATVSALYSADGLATNGFAISRDNRTIVMTDRSRGLMTLDVASGTASLIDCGCSPEGVAPMGDSLFRITGLTGSVFRVYDIRSGSVLQIPLAPGTVIEPTRVTPRSGIPPLQSETVYGGSR